MSCVRLGLKGCSTVSTVNMTATPERADRNTAQYMRLLKRQIQNSILSCQSDVLPCHNQSLKHLKFSSPRATILFEVEVTSVVWRRRPGSRVGWFYYEALGRVVLLPPAGAPHLSRRHSLRRAHNAPPAAVDRRPRNCAHTHTGANLSHILVIVS